MMKNQSYKEEEEESNIYKTLNVKETSIDKLYEDVKKSLKKFVGINHKSLINHVITLILFKSL